MINLILGLTSSNNGIYSNLISDSSKKGSRRVLCLDSGSGNTRGWSMSLIRSWRIYEFGGSVSTVSYLENTTSLESVIISSTHSDSNGVRGPLTLSSGNRTNDGIGIWIWTHKLRCLVWKNIWAYW